METKLVNGLRDGRGDFWHVEDNGTYSCGDSAILFHWSREKIEQHFGEIVEVTSEVAH